MTIQERADASVCSLLAVTSAMLAPLPSLCPHRAPGETTRSLSATEVDFGQNSAPHYSVLCPWPSLWLQTTWEMMPERNHFQFTLPFLPVT